MSTASMSTTIATTPATVAVDVSTVSMTTAVTTTPVMVDWGGVELNNDMDPPTASASTIASVASTTSESVLVADTLPSLVLHGIGRVDGRVGRIPVQCNSARILSARTRTTRRRWCEKHAFLCTLDVNT